MSRETGRDSIGTSQTPRGGFPGAGGPGDGRPGDGRPGDGARADWEQRIYQRAGSDGSVAGPDLPAPAWLTAEPGVGHVRLTWDPVPDAAGYVIERSGPDDAPEILRHGGSDVPAVVGPPFADTGIADNTDYVYRIAAIAGPEHPVAAWSGPVAGRTAAGAPGPARVAVDASTVAGRLDRVWRMAGAERLSQLREDGADGDRTGGADGNDGKIAAEFADALRLAHTELGASTVRAHAILHDDNAVVRRDQEGTLHYDFSTIDAIYDQLLGLGLRPVVELSFMPAALARDPELTVFTYRGIISPPADWAEWRELVTKLAAHLVERYGADEVARWAFEVWNEPNLVVFWPGTRQEYLRLYDESARAVKAVDRRLRVGGPATAAGEWIDTLAAHAASAGVGLDFVSTHTYGNLPLDVRPSLRRHGFDGIPIWWTEWGVGSTHFGPVHDSALGAPFVLSGFHSAQGRVDAVAYWVISDHFEELGRPPRLFHNGFGLLSVGNLRKPRYWAVHLAAHMGDQVLAAELDGDGAGALVQAWASRHANGMIDVLVWNGTINAALARGDTRLDRRVQLTITGLHAGPYQARLARVDERHSNVVAHCPPGVIWPDDALWRRLRQSDGLHTERLPDVTPDGGSAEVSFDLPMPGIARIRLSAGEAIARHE
jgi:xylan 1,4-beta-xylosidase